MKSGKTINFHVMIEKSERNTRRDLVRSRHGWPVDSVNMIDMVLDPVQSKAIMVPEKFLYVSTNADKIRLDIVKAGTTISFVVNNLIFLSDFTGVTAVSLHNTDSSGSPSETIKLFFA